MTNTETMKSTLTALNRDAILLLCVLKLLAAGSAFNNGIFMSILRELLQL